MSTEAANALLSGTPSFSFNEIGDTVSGVITDLDTSQATDYKTREPKFYKDGKPIMQAVVTLRTDEGEDGRIFCTPAKRDAIRDAARDAGVKQVEIGGKLTLKYYKQDEPESPGLSGKKLFKAKYEAPVKNVNLDDL